VIGALTRVRHTIAKSIHGFFDQHGFFWVNTPIITASDAEGAGALFRVSTLDLANLPRTPDGSVDFAQDFFGREAFLTVSGQLNVEAYCLALSKVYTFGPTFRAENSNTSRHLAEFWMIEPEIAFAALADNADLAEALLKHIFATVLAERGDDMAFFEERIEKGVIAKLTGIVQSEFARMDYTEAIEVLERSKQKFDFPVSWGIDLQSEHERYLTEKHVGRPVIVTNYPKAIKAFYMRVNDDGRTVAAMDVLAPGIGEIIGGSQREERLDVLDARMVETGLDPAHYGWYRDLRRYGTVPHAGLRTGLRADGRLRDRPRQRAGRHSVSADTGQREVLRAAAASDHRTASLTIAICPHRVKRKRIGPCAGLPRYVGSHGSCWRYRLSPPLSARRPSTLPDGPTSSR
jgi:asparaginyl-tRNA synthetase